jgi:hypothetical protein
MFRILPGENGMRGAGGEGGNWYEQRGDFHLTIYDPHPPLFEKTDGLETILLHFPDAL